MKIETITHLYGFIQVDEFEVAVEIPYRDVLMVLIPPREVILQFDLSMVVSGSSVYYAIQMI